MPAQATATAADNPLPRVTAPTSTEANAYAARDEVILQHLPLVRIIAVRVREKLPVFVDLDDLIHAGILGLMDAAHRFDAEKHVIFSSYAKHRIKGAILDSLRKLDWASRDLRRRHKQMEQTQRDLTTELQRAPSEEEMAERLGLDLDRWRQCRMELQPITTLSTSPRMKDQEELPALELPASPDSQPDAVFEQSELRLRLSRALKALPPRYQRVVDLYYSRQLTMKEIGGLMGINESRVSQIHKAALAKMAGTLALDGVTSSAMLA